MYAVAFHTSFYHSLQANSTDYPYSVEYVACVAEYDFIL